MRFLILGATGPTGIQLIHRALETHPSCTIVLYVRSPQNLPEDLATHSAITIIKGELSDRSSLADAMKGVDVVLSALGPKVMSGPFYSSGTPLAKAYGTIIEVMQEQHVKRLILLGTASIVDPHDRFSLAFSILVGGVATLARNAYNDVVAIGETVRNHGSDIDWTIVRVPFLTNAETTDVIAGYVGDGRTNICLSRKGFAAFVLDEVRDRQWIKQAPLVCSA
ncbi:hypothetical protein AX16_002566 [Volvariella volvacea WC 439]|nr:hypothetical protein AX16_002566 [Volvariella volvacea WC 439]